MFNLPRVAEHQTEFYQLRESVPVARQKLLRKANTKSKQVFASVPEWESS
jgi:hypothetical protein